MSHTTTDSRRKRKRTAPPQAAARSTRSYRATNQSVDFPSTPPSTVTTADPAGSRASSRVKSKRTRRVVPRPRNASVNGSALTVTDEPNEVWISIFAASTLSCALHQNRWTCTCASRRTILTRYISSTLAMGWADPFPPTQHPNAVLSISPRCQRAQTCDNCTDT